MISKIPQYWIMTSLKAGVRVVPLEEVEHPLLCEAEVAEVAEAFLP